MTLGRRRSGAHPSRLAVLFLYPYSSLSPIPPTLLSLARNSSPYLQRSWCFSVRWLFRTSDARYLFFTPWRLPPEQQNQPASSCNSKNISWWLFEVEIVVLLVWTVSYRVSEKMLQEKTPSMRWGRGQGQWCHSRYHRLSRCCYP